MDSHKKHQTCRSAKKDQHTRSRKHTKNEKHKYPSSSSSYTSSEDSTEVEKSHLKKLKGQIKYYKNVTKQGGGCASSVSMAKSKYGTLNTQYVSSSSSSKDGRRNKRQKLNEHNKPEEEVSTDIPLHLMSQNRSMAPMTKEEWEKKQNVVKRVYDETSGRHRLIKGDGEIIEEIVSRNRHRAINHQATKGDGDYFQSQLASHVKK